MAKKKKSRSYDEAVQWLREHSFDVLDAPGTPGRLFLKKHGVSAAIEKASDGGAKVFAYPGYLVGGEIARLIDQGYQKVLRTSRTEVPATADHLHAIHSFSEELKEALGRPSLYNESLGTVNDDCLYDRMKGREAGERKPRPWESPARKRA